MNVSALVAFAFVSSITPGPNNLMLWASGMNFGLRRTTRHLAGVNLGFSSLLLAVALGLGSLFQAWPILSTVLKLVGSAYLLYLAWRIATAGRAEAADAGTPLTFWQAVAFQYVNPKAWVMGITAAGTFIPATMPLVNGAVALTAIFWIVNLPCIATWAAAGTGIGRVLTNDRAVRAVNVGLGLLLVGTVYLINV